MCPNWSNTRSRCVSSFFGTEDNAQALSSKDMDAKCTRAASWPKYPQHLTKLDGQVSRYNADLTGEDCNRSEGKVFILAAQMNHEELRKFAIISLSFETSN